jgi:uncharacterized protein (TIGR00661 family)
MKILYAIQGTGNGHITRSKEVIAELQKHATVDILLSGRQSDIDLGYAIKYRLKGWSFTFGKRGGINLWDTALKTNTLRLLKDIWELPVSQYDFIVNDFEPVSAWAGLLRKVPVIALSNQCSIFTPNVPISEIWAPIGKAVLKSYAPAHHHFGLAYQNYNENVFTPIIRKEVRMIQPSSKGHFTVYLPSYSDDKIIHTLSQIKEAKWEVFSKHNVKPITQSNITIRPIDNDTFLESMASSNGVLCNAGFGTPTEAIYLNKPLAIIPMQNQFEQQCNALALEKMGATRLKHLATKELYKLKAWVEQGTAMKVHYPDQITTIVNQVMQKGKELQMADKLLVQNAEPRLIFHYLF